MDTYDQTFEIIDLIARMTALENLFMGYIRANMGDEIADINSKLMYQFQTEILVEIHKDTSLPPVVRNRLSKKIYDLKKEYE